MAITYPPIILGAVEGLVDEAVLMRLLRHVGVEAQAIHGKKGKAHIRQQLAGYNNAAQFSPWIVLVDLNSEADCAPALVANWLSAPAPQMCFRVAVREIEAWLLADHERLARFLSVGQSALPRLPEQEAHPKRTMVDLARRSRRRAIVEDMVPRPGGGRHVGPAYATRLIEFVLDDKNGWRPEVAALRADSLRRCLERLRRLVTSL